MESASYCREIINAIPFPYDSNKIKSIRANRNTLSRLFFDIIAEKLCFIDPSLYPPTNPEGLNDLVQAIEDQDSLARNQSCVFYYILMDYPLEMTQNLDVASYFSHGIDLPLGYQELIKGFHKVDELNYQQAVIHLSHPATKPTFTKEILTVLTNAENRSFTSFSAMAYITAVPPKLLDPSAQELVLATLSKSNLQSALIFCRSLRGEGALTEQHKHAYKLLVQAAVGANNFELIGQNVFRLANMPLLPVEAEVVHDILGEIIDSKAHSSQTISAAKDILFLRALHTSDDTLARKISLMDNSEGNRSGGSSVNWADLSRGLSLYMDAS